MRNQSVVVAIAFAVAAFTPFIVQADPVLVFTEESPTVLEATVGGVDYGSVSLISPYNWYWTYPTAPFSIGTIETILPAWTERDTSPGGEFGTVIEGEFINPTPGPDPTFATGGLLISSEHSFAQINDGPLSPMGSIVDPDVKFFFTNGSTEVFGVEFNEVPDTSPTIILAGMAVAGLVSARRYFRRIARTAQVYSQATLLGSTAIFIFRRFDDDYARTALFSFRYSSIVFMQLQECGTRTAAGLPNL